MSYHDSAQQYSTVQWYSHHTLKLIQCIAYSKMEKKRRQHNFEIQ